MSNAAIAEATFIPADQVAAKLGLSTPAFRRRIEALIDEEDFPQPMPYTGPRGATIWRTAHVNSWLREQGLPKVHTPPRAMDDPKVRQLFQKAGTA